MSLPPAISTEITALQTQVAAAAPLSSASRATIVAIQLNSAQLLSDIDAALATAAGALDTFESPTDPVAIINGVLGLEVSAETQSSLTDARGICGRANLNLDQLG